MAMSEERRANPNPLDIGGVLAILYTIVYFAMVGLLFFKSIPPENKDLINTLVGIMSAVQMAIIQWVFGSSKNAEAQQRSSEQRQGRAESVVQKIAETVPVAALAAVGGPAVTPAPRNPETGNVPAAEVQPEGDSDDKARP